jgi:hypothetical protein
MPAAAVLLLLLLLLLLLPLLLLLLLLWQQFCSSRPDWDPKVCGQKMAQNFFLFAIWGLP